MPDLTAVLDKLQIDYEIRDDEAWALCPAHDDHRPSWSMHLGSGRHNCFSCGFKGGLALLVAQVTGKTEGQARMWARRERLRAGVILRPPASQLPPVDFSRYSEAALYAFDDVPAQRLSERQLTPDAAAYYSIRWDTENNCWILPIRDLETGQLLGWQEKNEHYFRNRPRTVEKSRTLFGFRPAEHGGRSILVESPLDAARLLAAGFGGAVSSFGVSVSHPQLSALFRRDGQIVLALDNDAAGFRETHRILGSYLSPRLLIFNYGIAKAKDPGELTDPEIGWGITNALTRYQWLRRAAA